MMLLDVYQHALTAVQSELETSVPLPTYDPDAGVCVSEKVGHEPFRLAVLFAASLQIQERFSELYELLHDGNLPAETFEIECMKLFLAPHLGEVFYSETQPEREWYIKWRALMRKLARRPF